MADCVFVSVMLICTHPPQDSIPHIPVGKFLVVTISLTSPVMREYADLAFSPSGVAVPFILWMMCSLIEVSGGSKYPMSLCSSSVSPPSGRQLVPVCGYANFSFDPISNSSGDALVDNPPGMFSSVIIVLHLMYSLSRGLYCATSSSNSYLFRRYVGMDSSLEAASAPQSL